MKNNWYYYEPTEKKSVHYSVKAIFECSKCKQHRFVGEEITYHKSTEEIPQEEGITLITKQFIREILSKGKDTKCNCNKGYLIYMGYPVIIKKVKKEGIVKSMGMFNMTEGREVDNEWHWFKKKKSQLAYAKRHGTYKVNI